MRIRLAALLVISLLGAPPALAGVSDPRSTVDGVLSDPAGRSIAYEATIVDRPDLARLGFGGSGSWFAYFGADVAAAAQPTAALARDGLPSWVGAFNHTESPTDPGCTGDGEIDRGCLPTYAFRTFSQDGPARAAGGYDTWATLRLPSGECGAAGAIVDPFTFVRKQAQPDPTGVVFPPDDEPSPNNNNTINRIQLQDGTPALFYVGVITDTTGGSFDPGALAVRGNVGPIDHRQELAKTQIEPDPELPDDALAGNGVPDIHVFRVEHFRSGDYLKVRLKGSRTAPASFSGLLFDTTFDPRGPLHDRGRASDLPCRARAFQSTR